MYMTISNITVCNIIRVNTKFRKSKLKSKKKYIYIYIYITKDP